MMLFCNHSKLCKRKYVFSEIMSINSRSLCAHTVVFYLCLNNIMCTRDLGKTFSAVFGGCRNSQLWNKREYIILHIGERIKVIATQCLRVLAVYRYLPIFTGRDSNVLVAYTRTQNRQT